MEVSNWLGQLGKFQSIYEEMYLKLADKVDALQADHNAKMEQLDSEHEKKLRELEFKIQCSEEKYSKTSKQVDETKTTNAMMMDCLVDIQNSK